MDNPIIKRSIVIGGHKTSISLEDAFWQGLKEITGRSKLTLGELVAGIDRDRREGNLSSAVRLFVLDHFRTQLACLGQTAVRERPDAAAITMAG